MSEHDGGHAVHIIKKWRRDCESEKNRGGMRVGMPAIRVYCSDVERMCLEVERLRSENEALRGSLEYRPIETAPKDRRILLAKIVGHPSHPTALWWMTIGEWSKKYGVWWDRIEPAGLAGPTHWLPIPPIDAALGEQR